MREGLPAGVFSEIVEGFCHGCMRVGTRMYAAVELPLRLCACVRAR